MMWDKLVTTISVYSFIFISGLINFSIAGIRPTERKVTYFGIWKTVSIWQRAIF